MAVVSGVWAWLATATAATHMVKPVCLHAHHQYPHGTCARSASVIDQLRCCLRLALSSRTRSMNSCSPTVQGAAVEAAAG